MTERLSPGLFWVSSLEPNSCGSTLIRLRVRWLTNQPPLRGTYFMTSRHDTKLIVSQEPYRRRGLAKTLAAKLFREKSLDFADDGWCSADVAPDNDGSRGMCKKLNGKPTWRVSW